MKQEKFPFGYPNGSLITLHQVWHVPNLKRVLISFSMLAEDGYKMPPNESSWKIAKGSLHIGHGVRYKNLYPVTMISREESLNVAKMSTPSLWHGRLGHVSQTGLERLSALGYMPKLNRVESDFSEHCRYEKIDLKSSLSSL